MKRPLGDELLFGKLENGGHVEVDAKDGALVFTFEPVPPPAGSSGGAEGAGGGSNGSGTGGSNGASEASKDSALIGASGRWAGSLRPARGIGGTTIIA